MSRVKHLLSITDLTAKEIWQVLKLAKKLKTNTNVIPAKVFDPESSDRRVGIHQIGKTSWIPDQDFGELSRTVGDDSSMCLKDKNLVLIFEKPSLRTRLSLEISINQLGGKAIYFGLADMGSGIEGREPVFDVSKVVSSMADLIAVRVFEHKTLLDLAANSKVPVINALSDLEHPCQALADFLTIWEVKGKLEGLNIAYLGDGDNNVAHSLVLGSALLGINFKAASPKGYFINKDIFAKAKNIAPQGCETSQIEDPIEALKDADVVITDTWVSMGDEAEKQERIKVFKPFQINSKLMKMAKKDAIFLHCMPVNRGYEVTSEVVDGPKSVIFEEAENRLYIQKALLIYLASFLDQGG